jgi:hypothetical protein
MYITFLEGNPLHIIGYKNYPIKNYQPTQCGIIWKSFLLNINRLLKLKNIDTYSCKFYVRNDIIKKTYLHKTPHQLLINDNLLQ